MVQRIWLGRQFGAVGKYGSVVVIDGRSGERFELAVSYRSGRKHLPVVTLRRAA